MGPVDQREALEFLSSAAAYGPTAQRVDRIDTHISVVFLVGSLALGAGGEPVEWLVEMARFEEEQLFDRLAAAGRLDLPLSQRLAY